MNEHDLKKNARSLRRLEIALTIMALSFYALFLASTSSFAGEARRIAAVAPLAPLRPESRNGDYLKAVSGQPVEQTINAAIFDKTISNEMKARFDSFNSPYEHRRAYQLNGIADEINYQRASQELAEWTIKKLLQYHFENTVKNSVEEGAKRTVNESKSGGTKAAAQAVMAISKVQKAIANTTFNIGQETKTRFKYDFPSGVMRVGMTGPLVDATMDYRLRAADPQIGSVQQPEKLSIGLNRSFKELGAGANMRYGLLAETINYGMSKQIAGPLSAQVDQSHSIRDASKDETIYRVNFGVSF